MARKFDARHVGARLVGYQTRYKAKMFDKEYRVVIEAAAGGKDVVFFSSDDFKEADGIYEIAVANDPDGAPVLLMHRTRVVKRSKVTQV